MPRRYNSADSKRRILSACVRLFIEQGYHNTTIAQILKGADVTTSTFQNIFHTKSGVLMELTEFMFSNQFESARKVPGTDSPIYLYAAETAIQLTITELNENLRDIYVEAYSCPETSDYIQRHTSMECHKIFESYLPGYTDVDFYELDIGSSGIIRAYMAKKCDMYFTLDKKLQRFLAMALSAYNVPKEEQEKAIEFVMKLDIVKIANGIIQALFKSLAMKYDFELSEH